MTQVCLLGLWSRHAHRTPGGGATADRIVQQAAKPRPTGSRASGTRARSSATRSSPWRWPAGRRRRSSWAPRCCRPTRAIRSCRRTGRASTAAAMGRPGLHARHRPVAPAGDRGRVRPVLRPRRRRTPRSTSRCSPRCSAARASTSTATHFRVHIPASRTAAAAGAPGARRALAPRLLRVAGELHRRHDPLDGERPGDRDARRARGSTPAADGRRRPAPRIVAGLPVAVHDDVDEARATAAELFAGYGELPNYRRILDIGGAAGPADAAIVGDEAAVAAQIEALFDAGATDVWAAPFPVGEDRAASRTAPAPCSRSWRRHSGAMVSAPSLEPKQMRGVEIGRWSVPGRDRAVRDPRRSGRAAGQPRGRLRLRRMCDVDAAVESGVPQRSPFSRSNGAAQRVDHSTILLAIAGSYTAVITLARRGRRRPCCSS